MEALGERVSTTECAANVEHTTTIGITCHWPLFGIASVASKTAKDNIGYVITRIFQIAYDYIARSDTTRCLQTNRALGVVHVENAFRCVHVRVHGMVLALVFSSRTQQPNHGCHLCTNEAVTVVVYYSTYEVGGSR